MSVERLLAAAKVVLKRRGIARYGMASTRGEFDAARVDDDFHQLDAAIADAERQAADDTLPITPEWIAANFRHMGEQYSAYQHRDLPQLVWLSRFERLTLWDNPLPQIKNLGQLRKLVAALKGGE